MPAISSPDDQWFNVYSASGIPIGTALWIQNQSSALARIQESVLAPSPSDYSGRRIYPEKEAQIDSGSVGVWIRCVPSVQAYVQSAE